MEFIWFFWHIPLFSCGCKNDPFCTLFVAVRFLGFYLAAGRRKELYYNLFQVEKTNWFANKNIKGFIFYQNPRLCTSVCTEIMLLSLKPSLKRKNMIFISERNNFSSVWRIQNKIESVFCAILFVYFGKAILEITTCPLRLALILLGFQLFLLLCMKLEADLIWTVIVSE